jgi:cobaltochelatase CobS
MSEILIKHNSRTTRQPCKRCKTFGQDGLYWAHDQSRPDDTCKECTDREGYTVNGAFVLTEKATGKRHTCLPKPGTNPSEPIYEPPAPAVTTPAGNADAATKLAELLASLAPTVDMTAIIAQVDSVVNARMTEVVTAIDAKFAPLTIEIKQHDKQSVTITGAHKMLPKVLAVLNAPGIRKHVMLVGPAGSGKSTLAQHVSEALQVTLYEIALGPTMAESRVIGYKDANGNTVATFVREWAENGGILHLDEFDAGNPGVLTVFNSLLSNGHFGFPDKMIKLHPDCYVIASLNTYGRGADRTYKGRQALDEATLNRFVKIPIYYDDAVEESLCLATGMSQSKVTAVLTYVRQLRAKAEADRLPVIMGVRESEGLCSLVMAGLSAKEAITWRIRGGLSDADWGKLTLGVSAPSI